jgi:hypothetical protein
MVYEPYLQLQFTTRMLRDVRMQYRTAFSTEIDQYGNHGALNTIKCYRPALYLHTPYK